MAGVSPKKNFKGLIQRMQLKHRIYISLGLALLTFLLIFQSGLDWLVIAMITWNAIAFSFILTGWLILFTWTPGQIRERARQEDGSRVFVFLVIMVSSFASMVGVLLLVLSKDAVGTPMIIYIPVAIASMLLSWTMVHITFCFHYAHLFYGDAAEDPKIHAAGLEFPKERKPDYLDFAYFSFVIGMTFQVSDVEITSRTLRRLALLHGLLAFGLNTFVVALTINLIAGLKG